MSEPLKLALESLSLSGEEYSRLYGVLASLNSSLRHDLSNALGRTSIISEHALEALAGLAATLERPLDPVAVRDVLARLASDIKAMEKSARTAIGLVWNLLPRYQSDSHALVAKPVSVVQEIQRMFDPTVVTIEALGSPELEILFPEAALFGLLHELVINAKQATESPRILISWQQKRQNFLAVVEDSGPGFPGVAPSQKVEPNDLQTPRRGGIALWDSILHRSGGFMLLGRSSTLGGAEITIQIPVTAWYDAPEGSDGRTRLASDQ